MHHAQERDLYGRPRASVAALFEYAHKRHAVTYVSVTRPMRNPFQPPNPFQPKYPKGKQLTEKRVVTDANHQVPRYRRHATDAFLLTLVLPLTRH